MANNPHSIVGKIGSYSGIKGVSSVGTMDISELDAAAVAVATDSLPILTAAGATGKESFADLATAQAGTSSATGLKATNGVLSVDIADVTAATEPTTAYKVMLDTGGANKCVTLANVAKPIGEVFAATNLTSALSEVDGAGRVNINGTAAKTAPVAADSILVNDSEDTNSNKKVSFTNATKAIAVALGGTVTASGLVGNATTGALALAPNSLTGGVIAGTDYIIFGDTDAAAAPKCELVSDAAAIMGAIGMRPADDKSTIFYESVVLDLATASAVDTKVSDSLTAKGKLIDISATVTQAFNGDADSTIVISSAATGATAMAAVITVDKDAGQGGNYIGAKFGALPNSDNSEIVAAAGDVYAYSAANNNRSTGKLWIVLTFMKTA